MTAVFLITSTGLGYFGLYNVGNVLSITCTDNTGTSISIAWVDESDNLLASSSISVTLTINITDVQHDRVYTCRRFFMSAPAIDIDLKVIVLGEMTHLQHALALQVVQVPLPMYF